MMEKPIFPGTFLSSGEEYLPGQNAFEDLEGNICSSSVGKAVFDEGQKTVNVHSKIREPNPVVVETIIFGVVDKMIESKAFVKLIHAENEGKKIFVGNAFAVLPIFNVKNEYIKFLSDHFRVGDIIKARVVGVSKFTIELETKSSPSFGVIKGFCKSCRVPLRKVHNGFKCPNCANSALRKFSTEYLVK